MLSLIKIRHSGDKKPHFYMHNLDFISYTVFLEIKGARAVNYNYKLFIFTVIRRESRVYSHHSDAKRVLN
jgi:hypothetical protein